ncbi:MAG: hypothetical protein R3C14_22505 [Caldilineaceae bacterium]
MTKNEFYTLFLQVLEQASCEVEDRLNAKISRNFDIHLYGVGYSDYSLDVEKVVDIIYIDSQRFYRVIDVSITGIRDDLTQVFVRVSDHEPSSFDRTWNTPPGYGPFKQLIAKEIKRLN